MMEGERGGLYLRQMEIGPMANFVYLVGSAGRHEALVVDPAWDVEAILQAAQEDSITLRGALVTHTHPDHVNGLGDLLDRMDLPVYVHKQEAPFLRGLGDNLRQVEGGTEIPVGDLSLQLLHTPGHSPGSQCFLVQGRLISGDTLFIRSCGRTDLPGGSSEELYRSLSGLARLEDSTLLLPGHNYAEKPVSTLEEERRENPFLVCTSLPEFLRIIGGYV